jgi:O-antigen/teichoic acid export membrane protein
VSADSRANLDRKLVHGLAWTSAGTTITQLLSWGGTLLVARILTPSDYGIMGMATMYLGLVQLVSELGVGAAVIQRRDLTEDQIARIAGFSVVAGVAFFLVSTAASGLVAMFFNEPRVQPVIVVISLTFILGGLRAIPYSLLARDMVFSKVAIIDVIEAITLIATTFALALGGAGYWALAGGPLVSRTVGVIIANAYRRHRIAWPFPVGEIRDALRFGGNIVLGRVFWYAYSNADFAIVGKRLGTTQLGIYSLGWSIASVPITKFYALYQKVTGPVFSASQNNPAALRRYFLGLTEAIAIVTFPVSIGLALVAQPFVIVAFGKQWLNAVAPLQALAVSSALRSFQPIVAQLLISTGHAREEKNTSIFAAIIMPPLFFIGAQWGLVGVALAWVVGTPIYMASKIRYACRITEMRYRDYMASLLPATSGVVVMSAFVFAAMRLTDQLPALVQLMVAILVGAAAYGLAILLLHGRRVRALWGAVTALRARPSAA